MDKKLNKTPKGANMTNPTENIIIDEDNRLDISEEMDVEFYPEMLMPEGDGDDYSPTDDGSWMDR